MTEAHEFFRQIRHDTFCASMTLRRNAFPQRRDLSNLHLNPFLCRLVMCGLIDRSKCRY